MAFEKRDQAYFFSIPSGCPTLQFTKSSLTPFFLCWVSLHKTRLSYGRFAQRAILEAPCTDKAHVAQSDPSGGRIASALVIVPDLVADRKQTMCVAENDCVAG